MSQLTHKNRDHQFTYTNVKLLKHEEIYQKLQKDQSPNHKQIEWIGNVRRETRSSADADKPAQHV